MADLDGFLGNSVDWAGGSTRSQRVFEGVVGNTYRNPEVALTPGGHILDVNTIALWRMDDEKDAGDYLNARDTSGNGYDLTLGGGTLDGIISGPDGEGFGKSMRSEYFSHPYDAGLTALFLGEWTMEGWYRDRLGASTGYLWSYNSSGESLATNFLVGINRNGAGNLAVFHESGSGTNQGYTSSCNVGDDDVWNHIAVTKTDVGGGNHVYRFYKNGVLVDTSGNVPNAAGGGTQVLYLGSSTGGASPYIGGVGAQRWSKVVRTPAEIAASFARAGKDHEVDADTVICIPTDEQPDLYDEAKNGHLRLNLGTDQPSTSLISDAGKSRRFNGTRYTSTRFWKTFNYRILDAINGGGLTAGLQGELTIEFWGRLGTTWQSVSSRGACVIGDPGTESTAENFFSFDVLSSRKGRVFAEYAGAANDVADTTDPILTLDDEGDIHHYAITSVASGGFSTFEFYVDGVLLHTSNGGENTHTDGVNGRWQVGQGQGQASGELWLGQIDDMRISDKKRSAIEILESYANGVAAAEVLPPVESGPTYRMRATDTDLSAVVYWNATSLDDTGAQYTGNSAALTNIVVQNIIGA
jgi:hypothetical protein